MQSALDSVSEALYPELTSIGPDDQEVFLDDESH